MSFATTAGSLPPKYLGQRLGSATKCYIVLAQGFEMGVNKRPFFLWRMMQFLILGIRYRIA